MRRQAQGQVTAELAVLFTFVIAGFIFMGFYLQRAAQGSTKANTDSIGTQFSRDSAWNFQTVSSSKERGVTTTSSSCSRGSQAVGVGTLPDPTITAAINSPSTADDCVPGAGAGSPGSILTAPVAN